MRINRQTDKTNAGENPTPVTAICVGNNNHHHNTPIIITTNITSTILTTTTTTFSSALLASGILFQLQASLVHQTKTSAHNWREFYRQSALPVA